MATRGPKPIPKHLKLVRNNPGKRKLNDKEPAPDDLATLAAPPYFSGYALAEWNRRIAQLTRLGVLKETDDGALIALCQAWHRWREAEDALARFSAKDALTHGLMIKTTPKKDGSGGNAIQNPLVGTANKAMELYIKLAVEFGMTPSARTRISVGKDADDNPYAKFGGAA